MFPGFGTLINFLLIVLGSLLGLKGTKILNRRLREGMIHGIGLFTFLLGVKLLFENKPETLKVFLTILLGTAVGYLFDLEGRIERLSKRGADFTNAFLTSSVLFTVGPMTLLGCILEGTKGDSSLILSKATMDGFSSLILSSSLGKGVLFSAFFVLFFQGSITILAFLLGDFISPQSMANSLFIGGGIMVVTALKLWGLLKEVRSVNLLFPLLLSLFL